MRILIDMNLSPAWGPVFVQAGWQARHWEDVGDARAPDSEIMEWARRSGFVVFTHDLDYGALLAATSAVAPSVIQLRSEDTRPATMASMVIAALRSHRESLEAGALMTVNPRRMRVTLLPLKKS